VSTKKKKTEEPLNRTVEILRKIQGHKETADLGLQMMDSAKIEDVPRIPTGVFSVDLATGGGYPQGRIIEIYGPEGGGKTTLALHCLAAAQALGNTTAMIDVEHAYDPAYGQVLGVDHSRMLFSQPDSGEHALSVVDALCDHMKHGDVILIDSVANLTPQAELDGDMGDSHPGLLARLMGQGLRKLTARVSQCGVTVIFINQIRYKIGVIFGNPETTSGGKALRFYASQRVDVRFIGKLKEQDSQKNPLGQVAKVKVVKNKVSPPFREAELNLYYGYGFLRAADVFTVGVREKVIEKEGNTYSFQEEKLAVGKEKSKHFLADNVEIMDKIEEAVRAKYSASK